MGRGQELLDAARNGDKRTVEKILGQITKRSGPFTSLRRGAGVNVQDDNGYTPLHHAALNGHREIVRLLLSVDASPCIIDKKGATPLHLAAWKGDSEVVAMLLAHKNPPVNIDQKTSDHETALLIAAHFGHADVVAQLTAKGANVEIRNIKNESALDLAAQYGRLETVQHLLRVMPQLVEQYNPPKSRAGVFTSTPLHRASKNGRKEVVKALLAAGMDPNVQTFNGTPLHEAACFGKASVVRILLANGADMNMQDRKRRTVHDLLADYPEEATRKVRKVIREFENNSRVTYESEEDLPPFPVQDYSPTGFPPTSLVKAPVTHDNTNKNNNRFISPSSSYQLTKNQSTSFVKKLASKCLVLKAKFNSAPNISNNAAQESEVDIKSKQSDYESGSNTLLIGNSKFFKLLSKKEESGEMNCNDEFDTISLDRLSILNRDTVVNRSNRSCPGFKTSLPNISENNELSDESITDSIVKTESDCDKNKLHTDITEAVNSSVLFENTTTRTKDLCNKKTVTSDTTSECVNFVNECYESYEFIQRDIVPIYRNSIPRPPPRPNILPRSTSNDNVYENIITTKNSLRPTPATRLHLPQKLPLNEMEKKVVYENVTLLQEKRQPEPPKRTFIPTAPEVEEESTRSLSRSSSMSSDSMIDESNLEDILLSEKSKSFKHGKKNGIYKKLSKHDLYKSLSNSSVSSGITEASAIENVDCSGDADGNNVYLSMTGTLPISKAQGVENKKVLFRHKTFTNMEMDRSSVKLKDSKWSNNFFKETLAHYHIRGTGHCMYNAPTVSEFISIFNKDTLYKDVAPFSIQPSDKRDSYFETAICFCRPKPPKHHSSAEDLLEILPQNAADIVHIDMDALKRAHEIQTASFRCFCDSENCVYHADKRDDISNFVVKFSAIKKSISTPDITLNISPSLTFEHSALVKNKSLPYDLEEPYAVINVEDILSRRKGARSDNVSIDTSHYVSMSPSTLSSSSSNRLYSLKDISDVISLHSTLTKASQSSASDSNPIPLEKSTSSEHSGHWSLQSCESNVTIKSDASFVTCFEESEEDSDDTLHSDGEESSDTETVKSDISTSKRPWIHSSSFRFGNTVKYDTDVIIEEQDTLRDSSKVESGISVEDSESSSSDCEGDSGVPGTEGDVSLGASLERGSGLVAGVCSGSGRRRWDEAEGTSEGDALSVSSAASSCAPLHLAHHHDYSKVSPTPPKKPPRRNLSVSPTHANSPSSGYSYELRPHARSQDDLDDIQGAKHYLKHGRSVDQYVDSKLSYSEYEDNHNSPRIAPVPNPRPSLKHRSQPVAITAMYENVPIKEQNPRRKLKRNNFAPPYENYEPRMNDNRVRKFSNQERSSLESLLDDQSMNSPSDCERYYDGPRVEVPSSPTHYKQPTTPDHPPPSARQAENSIHETIRPLSQLIMEVVEEIRVRKKSEGQVANSGS